MSYYAQEPYDGSYYVPEDATEREATQLCFARLERIESQVYRDRLTRGDTMTKDDIAPLGTDDDAYPCPECKGAGFLMLYTPTGGHSIKCGECNGSGYGPPPPEMARLRAHCLERLSKWAHRSLRTEEF